MAQEEKEPEKGSHPQEFVDQEEHKGVDEDEELMKNDQCTEDLKLKRRLALKMKVLLLSDFDDDLFSLTTDSGKAHLSKSQKHALKLQAVPHDQL